MQEDGFAFDSMCVFACTSVCVWRSREQGNVNTWRISLNTICLCEMAGHGFIWKFFIMNNPLRCTISISRGSSKFLLVCDLLMSLIVAVE